MSKVIEEAITMLEHRLEHVCSNPQAIDYMVKDLITELESKNKEIERYEAVVELVQSLKSNLYYHGMASTLPDNIIVTCNELDEALSNLKER